MTQASLLRTAPVAAALAFLLVLLGCGDTPEPDHGWRVNDEFVRAVNRGVSCMDRYDYEGATTAYRRALELSPASIDARIGLAIAEFNNPRAQAGTQRGVELIDEVLAREPENPQALYLRGIFHLQLGEPAEAVDLLERVVARKPHDAVAWYVLARALHQADRPAVETLRRTVEENPLLASAWYDLFLTARREGNDEEAAQAMEKFQELQASPFKVQVEFPKYRLMGSLAIARPLTETAAPLVEAARFSLDAAREIGILSPAEVTAAFGPPLAAGDVDGDGNLDLVTVGGEGEALVLLRGSEGGAGFTDATDDAGLVDVTPPRSVAVGDFDNDGHVDLFVAGPGANQLWRGAGDGTFTDVTAETGAGGAPDVESSCAVFLDADHDADLDLYVCNLTDAAGRPAANQLLRNNADGTFTDVAAEMGAACAETPSLGVAPIDLDDDRHTDLIVFQAGAPVTFLRNELHDGYRAWDPVGVPVAGDGGGVAQDFDGDGLPDLLLGAYADTPPALFLGKEGGRLERSAQFDVVAAELAGPTRIADVDLDGDLDVVAQGETLRVLSNDGRGAFRPLSFPATGKMGTLAAVFDVTGDGVVDVLAADGGRLFVHSGALSLPAHWLGVSVTGKLFAESMRSPKSGFGTKVEVRVGLHAQVLTHTGLYGGPAQSTRPLVFGLDGAGHTDFVALRWPDGVHQSETDLAADQLHVIEEVQRKPDSCPMLFAWNGRRFGFVGDFAGVGGLGYYAGPDGPPPPQVRELVRLGAEQLVAREGRFELRVAEPMQEVAYVDRLELLAIDHDPHLEVQPDERLVLTGPPPTQQLLALGGAVFPARVFGPEGEVAASRLRSADRSYAYEPTPDARFVGYCEPHALVLDFDAKLSALSPRRRTYLLVDATLEFPYSQTNFAAAQAGVSWDAPRLELHRPDGAWETLVDDIGAPGGMMRTIAVDLTDELPAGPCRLRLTSNLELYYDRVFIAQDHGPEALEVASVPLVRATLRRLGFPQEFSPDGGHPHLYDYHNVEASCNLRRLPGRYTRYGPVEELLGSFDDHFVVMATGDEIALEFDATTLPPLAGDRARTYVLVSHAYCKDMDLHSVGPRTVGPLPFQAMTGYPYAPEEAYPTDKDTRRYQQEYNTRVVR